MDKNKKEHLIQIIDIVSNAIVENTITEQYVQQCIYGKVDAEIYDHILDKYRGYDGDFFQFYLETNSDVNRWLLENLGIDVEPDKYPDYTSRVIAQIVQGKKRIDIYPFETEAVRIYALFGNNNSLSITKQLTPNAWQEISNNGIDEYGNDLNWSRFWTIADADAKERLIDHVLDTLKEE